MDLDAYRTEAEAFASAIGREYLLHFSGRREELHIEPIYERHAGLFSSAAVEELREAGTRPLLEFAVEGLIGRATKAEAVELAHREASLEVELDGERIPYRRAAVVLANERDPDRRAALDAARLAAGEERLDPLRRTALERSHALAAELGWPSYRTMCEDLSGIDLARLGEETAAFLDATEAEYEAVVEPHLREQLGFGFERLRRSDLAAFFRAPTLDGAFPAERMLDTFDATFAGLGVDAHDGRVTLDVESRPRKSPRAFCSAVRVPEEVHLVIAPVGGHDDYRALFHESGHAFHYAHVDAARPFEARYLGDNSVTEGFAFLLEHLVADPEWIERRLAAPGGGEIAAHARARKLVFLRRYAAKLAYELELHDAPTTLDPLRETYARRLSAAVHVDWPAATWLSDVDAYFYAARYLRAWALEGHLRRALRERFGAAWFEQPAAGELLRSLWREGQGIGPEELMARAAGGPAPERLDFTATIEDLAAPA